MLARHFSFSVLTLAISLFFTASSFAITNGNPVPTIPGTNPTGQNTYKWAAAFHEGNDQLDLTCGASLIGSRFAITSAHCLSGTDPNNRFITVGGYDVGIGNQTGQTIRVASSIIHPDFNGTTFSHDLALLVLQEDARAVETPIYVTTRELAPNQTATIIGWGDTTPCLDGVTGCGPASDQLLQAQVTTLDRATCESILTTLTNPSGLDFDTTHICSGINSTQQDACGADSGGPIFVVGPDGNPVQIGTTSWGGGCGQVGSMTAYSNLGQLIGFLLDNLGGQTNANLVDYAVSNDQRRVAEILDRIGSSAAVGSALRQDYGRLFMNGVAGTSKSLQSLLPTSAFEMQSMVDNMISFQSQNLKTRIRTLRDGLAGGQMDVSGFRLVNRGSAGSLDNNGLTSSNGLYGSQTPLRQSETDYQPSNMAADNTNTGRMYDPALYADGGANGQNLAQQAVPTYPSASANTLYSPPTAPAVAMPAYDANTTDYQPTAAQRVNPYLGAPPVTNQVPSQRMRQSYLSGSDNSNLDTPPLGEQASDYEYSRAGRIAAPESSANYDPNQVAPSRLTDVVNSNQAYAQNVDVSPLPQRLNDGGYANQVNRLSDSNEPTSYDAYGNPIRLVPVSNGAYQASLALDQVAETNPYYTGRNSFNRGDYREAPPRPVADDGGIMGTVSGWFGGNSDLPKKDLPRTVSDSRQEVMKRSAQYPGQPLGMYNQKLSRMQAPASSGSVATTAASGSYNQQYRLTSPARVNSYSYRYRQAYSAAPYQQVTTPYAQVSGAPAQQLGTVAIPYTPAREPAQINADRRWGVFVSGDVRFGNEALLRRGGRTKIDNTGFSVGLDYRLANNSFVGAALSYAHGSFNTSDFSDVQGDGYAMSLYGTTSYAPNTYLDGFISVGYHSFDSERTLFVGNGETRLAKAEPDAWHYVAEAETGYDFKQNAWKYGPYAGFRLSYADFASYAEDGGGTFNLNVHDRDDFSAIGSLGFGGSRQFQMSNGGLLVPAMRVAFNHEFGDGQANVKSNFLVDPSSTFTTEGAMRERSWLSVNPTVTAAFPNNWLFQAYYAHDFLRYNVETHIFNLAARYKW